MASTGATTKSRQTGYDGSDLKDLIIQHNGWVQSFCYAVENLAAGADITERGVYQAPVALLVSAVAVVHHAAGTGLDGSNTAVLTLRNITQALDIATVTLSANPAANAASTLAVTAAAADVAAGDVLGIVVTQGATADLGAHSFVVHYRTAEKIGDADGTAITA